MSVLTSVSGFPRIGQNRELKKIIEAYWKGVATLDDVRATAKELRAKHWKLQEAGIDLIPSNDFSYYDQMLDTAILLNVIPQRATSASPSTIPKRRCSPWPRLPRRQGRRHRAADEEVVHHQLPLSAPEVDEATDIKLNSTKPFDEFNEAKALGITTKPVLIGPYTSSSSPAIRRPKNSNTTRAWSTRSPPSTPRSWPSSPSWAPNGIQIDEPYRARQGAGRRRTVQEPVHQDPARTRRQDQGAAQHLLRPHRRRV